MSKAPSMPMYWDAYIADTTHLTTEEHGAYMLLLGAMWRRDGSVPDDDKDIARIVGLTPTKWRNVRKRLSEFLTVENGYISQKRLTEIWENTQEKINKNKQNGAKGGRPKSSKNSDLAKANGSVSDNPNKTIPEPEPYKEKELSNDSSKKADAFPTNSDLAEFVREWNSFAKQNDLAQVQKLTDTRKRHLKARLKDCGNLPDIIHILHQTATSAFLMGENKRGWKMDFDFFVTESRFTKIAEGAYDRSTSQPQQSSTNYMAELAAQDFGFAPKQERTDHGQGPIIDGTLQVAKGRS